MLQGLAPPRALSVDTTVCCARASMRPTFYYFTDTLMHNWRWSILYLGKIMFKVSFSVFKICSKTFFTHQFGASPGPGTLNSAPAVATALGGNISHFTSFEVISYYEQYFMDFIDFL